MDDGLVRGDDGKVRCFWAHSDPLYSGYHDDEWGHPVNDDRRLFEKLCLEGFMSGLSWLTILRKRENFRKAFKNFEPPKVARFGPRDVERLMQDAGIVRNRAKIEATINNAQQYNALVKEFGSLASYVWSYEPSKRPRKLDWATVSQTAYNAEAKAMSKDLKRRGWAFVGPTTVYSTMQAVGVVNDHVTGCYVRAAVERERKAFRRP